MLPITIICVVIVITSLVVNSYGWPEEELRFQSKDITVEFVGEAQVNDASVMEGNVQLVT